VLAGKITSVSLFHPWNALLPKVFTDAGMVMLVSPELLKADSGIVSN
jgi:hypothetical protein